MGLMFTVFGVRLFRVGIQGVGFRLEGAIQVGAIRKYWVLRGISHHRAAGRCKGRWSSGLPPFKKYSTYTCKCETHTAGRRTKGGPCEVSQAMEAHRSSLTLKLSVKEPRCGTFQPKTSGRVLLPLAVATWTHQLLFHPCPSFLPL